MQHALEATEGNDNPGCSVHYHYASSFKNFIWLSSCFQSGSSFNVPSRQLFKSALNKKQLSLKVPRDKYYQMRSMGSHSWVSLGVLDVKMPETSCVFPDKIILKLLFVLALGNCLKKLERTPRTKLFCAVHSNVSTLWIFNQSKGAKSDWTNLPWAWD